MPSREKSLRRLRSRQLLGRTMLERQNRRMSLSWRAHRSRVRGSRSPLRQLWSKPGPKELLRSKSKQRSPPAALPPVETGVVPRTSNRRRDVRTRVSFTACIRQGDGGEEIVECDNVSRGGISFRSRKCYAVDSTIEVAAPHSPGGHAIFATASIQRVETLPGGTLFRYGAAYTAQRKPG